MADLDDFFAKKDRKRQKAMRRGAAEEPRKEEARPEQPPQPQQPASQHKTHYTSQERKDHEKQEEDEWREVEVAKKADYSGLKIQHLTPGQEINPGIEGNIVGASSGVPVDQKTKGPWNKMSGSSDSKMEEKEPPPPSEVILPPPPSSKAYVLPILRNKPPGFLDGPAVRPKHGKQVAPDITSEEFFPTLGCETKRSQGGGGNNWSDASRGGPPSRPQVSLGNHYNSHVS